MFDFFIPKNLGSLILLVIVLLLVWYSYKSDQEESLQRAKRHEEEKDTLGTVVEITLTRTQVKRHLDTILERIASEKLLKVMITNTHEAPHGVLLSYGEYKALLAFKELHEYNAKERIKERQLWEEAAKRLSHDPEYLEQLRELG